MNTITMGLVGVNNVTVTTSVSEEDRNMAEDSKRPVERVAFDNARRRFAKQGAEETRYFLA